MWHMWQTVTIEMGIKRHLRCHTDERICLKHQTLCISFHAMRNLMEINSLEVINQRSFYCILRFPHAFHFPKLDSPLRNHHNLKRKCHYPEFFHKCVDFLCLTKDNEVKSNYFKCLNYNASSKLSRAFMFPSQNRRKHAMCELVSKCLRKLDHCGRRFNYQNKA